LRVFPGQTLHANICPTSMFYHSVLILRLIP
jgi:hypothetical protein